MIEIIKKDFSRGLKTFKFWASVISERLKVEINVLRLIGEMNKIASKRDELLKEIGKEIYSLWGSDLNIKDHEKLSNLMREIKELETDIENKKKKMDELKDMSRWNL